MANCCRGDIDVDGGPNLTEVISVMKILSGLHTGPATIDTEADVDQNGTIFRENSIYEREKWQRRMVSGIDCNCPSSLLT